MDRYDREERRHDRGAPDPGDADPQTSDAPGEFPWRDTGPADQPAPVWEEPPATGQADVGTRYPAATGAGSTEGNGMAVAGFVLSLAAFIPIPFLNFICWILAVVFSSIGLRRANKQGRPRRGLAIAGLCLCLVALVVTILFTIWFFQNADLVDLSALA